MCAEYNIKTSERDLTGLLNISLLNETATTEWDQHIRLYGKAPALVRRAGSVKLEALRFSLLPPGGRIPFTANTRLDDWDERRGLICAFERPTWRQSFLWRRCIVPMTRFLEPIYSGSHAGQMMGFFKTDNSVILVAAIYQESVEIKTAAAFTGFSLLTDFAHPFVREIGHHRTLLTLPPTAALDWLAEKEIEGEWGMRFLLRHKEVLKLNVEPQRTLKNWKARVKNAQGKAATEQSIEERVHRARRERGFE